MSALGPLTNAQNLQIASGAAQSNLASQITNQINQLASQQQAAQAQTHAQQAAQPSTNGTQINVGQLGSLGQSSGSVQLTSGSSQNVPLTNILGNQITQLSSQMINQLFNNQVISQLTGSTLTTPFSNQLSAQLTSQLVNQLVNSGMTSGQGVTSLISDQSGSKSPIQTQTKLKGKRTTKVRILLILYISFVDFDIRHKQTNPSKP